ncbi:MAG: ATP-dependent DNA ligase, partial [Dehalococcoidia bacterium]|nr:ATP-dependent DNA ligase [Dehalococcoidia bacterium]
KIKAFKSAEFVIAGYTEGQGNRGGLFGSLVLAYRDDEGRLVWAGNAGSGFDDKGLRAMKARLDAVKTAEMPFDVAPDFSRIRQPWVRGRGKERIQWVDPVHVAEIKYAQWTDGGNLRAPVFLRLRPDVKAEDVRRGPDRPLVSPAAAHRNPDIPAAASTDNPDDGVDEVLAQLANDREKLTLQVGAERVALTNLNKVVWPAAGDHRAYTKRDLIRYYARVSPWLLPHLKDRPNTLVRYPNGIDGQFFYQKHVEKTPPFVETLRLFSSHNEGDQEYLMVNNLPTLVWLAQIADIEMHPWLARYAQEPDATHASMDATGSDEQIESSVLSYPDFLLVDLDPYIYSGDERKGEEPGLNRAAFAAAVNVAQHARELFASIGLSAFIKTTGKTGLHLFVPVVREYTYDQLRSVAETLGRHLMQEHPDLITMEWSTRNRTGKIFWDHNMNVRGKNLASVYSARPTQWASVSVPVRWEELEDIYPASFTIETVFERLDELGDLWADILEAKHDLAAILEPRN